jgi:hypothetical protein
MRMRELPQWKVTQKNLFGRLLEICDRERDSGFEGALPHAEMTAMAASKAYMRAHYHALPLVPANDGTCVVRKDLDEGQAIAYALGLVAHYLEMKTALLPVNRLERGLRQAIAGIDAISKADADLKAIEMRNGTWWVRPAIDLDELRPKAELLNVHLTAAVTELADKLRRSPKLSEGEQDNNLLSLLVRVLHSLEPKEIAELVDDGQGGTARRRADRVSKRRRGANRDRSRLKWEPWYVGETPEGFKVLYPQNVP